MYIKGQNLRVGLIQGGKILPLAAATSCSVHVSLQTASVTTKDSTGDWEEFEPVGHNFDVSASALVFEFAAAKYNLNTEQAATIAGAETKVYVDASSAATLSVPKGHTLKVITHGKSTCLLKVATSTTQLTDMSTDDFSWTNTTSGAVKVKVAAATPGTVILLQDPDTSATQIPLLEVGDKVSLSFTHTSGDQNRKADGELLRGQAIVSEITYTATNKNMVTAEAKFQGTGAIEAVDA